jgi:hypothetical protein
MWADETRRNRGICSAILIGLANHIHILKGAELEKYVKEFAGNWLK